MQKKFCKGPFIPSAVIGAVVAVLLCMPSPSLAQAGEKGVVDAIADFLRSLMPRPLFFVEDEKGDFKVLRGHTDRVWTVAFNPDGRTLASGAMDDNIIIWDAATGNVLHTLRGHTKPIFSLIYSREVKGSLRQVVIRASSCGMWLHVNRSRP